MADVVSPRGVTYKVTCHQWLRKGLSSILTLPTICVHRCRVWQVSLHASKGSAGQSSARSPWCALLVLSMCCSSWLSLCSIAAHDVCCVILFFPLPGIFFKYTGAVTVSALTMKKRQAKPSMLCPCCLTRHG